MSGKAAMNESPSLLPRATKQPPPSRTQTPSGQRTAASAAERTTSPNTTNGVPPVRRPSFSPSTPSPPSSRSSTSSPSSQQRTPGEPTPSRIPGPKSDSKSSPPRQHFVTVHNSVQTQPNTARYYDSRKFDRSRDHAVRDLDSPHPDADGPAINQISQNTIFNAPVVNIQPPTRPISTPEIVSILDPHVYAHVAHPCTRNSLMHNLSCGHKIVTVRPEDCARNCKRPIDQDRQDPQKPRQYEILANPRDMDESFGCQLCKDKK